MSKSPKKMAVLAVLQSQVTPLSLPEILKLLDSSFSERTVRRWLTEMVKAGLVIKEGKKRGTHYKTISSFNLDNTISFNEKSIEALNYINRPLFERTPNTYNEKWLEEYVPNKTFYLNKEIRIQLLNAGDKNKMHFPAGTYARQISNRLLIDLSYNSSRLEGNTYSLLDTEKLILEGTDAPGKLDEEKIMILNHKEAIAFLINNAHQIQTDFTTICTIHYLLSDGLVPVQYAGKVRDYGVRISGSTYVPWENPDRIKKQLQLICDKAIYIKDPFEQSIFLLAHISYLQAFSDVNKRTSRLSANIPLIKNNLIPLSFNDISKSDYHTAMLAIYELNDVHALIELYVHSYLRTCKLYEVTLDAISYDEVRVRYRQQRRNIIGYIITHGLINKKMDLFIKKETKNNIEEKDQAEFMEDILEDLREISPQRIAGLGITQFQLQEWMKKKSNAEK